MPQYPRQARERGVCCVLHVPGATASLLWCLRSQSRTVEPHRRHELRPGRWQRPLRVAEYQPDNKGVCVRPARRKSLGERLVTKSTHTEERCSQARELPTKCRICAFVGPIWPISLPTRQQIDNKAASHMLARLSAVIQQVFVIATRVLKSIGENRHR